MSKIRLAAFDFDGTLVPKDIPNLDLETDIVALLQKLRQQGVYITVATGRHPSYILKRIHRFTFDAIVGYSGNVTLIANQLQAFIFDPAVVRQIAAYAGQLPQLDVTAYTREGIACCGSRKHQAELKARLAQTDRICDLNGVTEFLLSEESSVPAMRVSRICLHYADSAQASAIQTAFPKQFHDYRLVRTGNRQMEVLHASRSKATETLKLAARFQVRADQVAAVGDDENDLEMLQRFHPSYYVGSHHPLLQQAATYTAASCRDVLAALTNKEGERNA